MTRLIEQIVLTAKSIVGGVLGFVLVVVLPLVALSVLASVAYNVHPLLFYGVFGLPPAAIGLYALWCIVGEAWHEAGQRMSTPSTPEEPT